MRNAFDRLDAILIFTLNQKHVKVLAEVLKVGKILTTKCPNCGASCEYEAKTTQLYCSHCGTRVIYLPDKSEHVEIKRDETKIHESNNDVKVILYTFVFLILICILAVITLKFL